MTTRRDTDPAYPLDGNAAAGLLSEVFVVDMTVAILTCEGCGGESRVGEARLYGGSMGAILRCPHCDLAVVRVVRTVNSFWLDMRGARSIAVGRDN